MQPYTTTDILLARIETLVSLGWTREDAAKMVADTYTPRVRPPGA